MGYRVTLKEVAEEYGYETVEEMIEDYAFESVVPACCSESCEVEPDGHCSHGHKSKIDGIDQPTQAYRRSYSTGGKGYDNFVLARGQPNTRASINHNKTFPRNKGKPD